MFFQAILQEIRIRILALLAGYGVLYHEKLIRYPNKKRIFLFEHLFLP